MAVLADLNPAILLVVGIGGGVPSGEATLGDVIVSTHIYDFRVGAVDNGRVTYVQHGGPLSTLSASIATFIPAIQRQLGNWNSDEAIRMLKPPVLFDDEKRFYGPSKWKETVRKHLTQTVGDSLRSPQSN